MSLQITDQGSCFFSFLFSLSFAHAEQEDEEKQGRGGTGRVWEAHLVCCPVPLSPLTIQGGRIFRGNHLQPKRTQRATLRPAPDRPLGLV